MGLCTVSLQTSPLPLARDEGLLALELGEGAPFRWGLVNVFLVRVHDARKAHAVTVFGQQHGASDTESGPLPFRTHMSTACVHFGSVLPKLSEFFYFFQIFLLFSL